MDDHDTRELTSSQRVFFRDMLRDARAMALKNSEGYQQILFALERLGSFGSGDARSLSVYRSYLRKLAIRSPLAEAIPQRYRDWHTPFDSLYESVKDARNDALHQGAFARHLTTHAVRLALIMEDALMSEAKTVADFMVRQPVSALPWHPISFVRQQMLENSFTYLPVRLDQGDGKQWYLVSDFSITLYLQSGSKSMRKRALSKPLDIAVREHNLRVVPATVEASSTVPMEALQRSNGLPILVCNPEHPDEIVGILTPFDLL